MIFDYEYLLKQLEFQNRQCFYSDETSYFSWYIWLSNGRSPTVDRIVPEKSRKTLFGVLRSATEWRTMLIDELLKYAQFV